MLKARDETFSITKMPEFNVTEMCIAKFHLDDGGKFSISAHRGHSKRSDHPGCV